MFSRRNVLILGAGAAAAGALGVTGYAQADVAATASEWIRLPIITANIGRKRLSKREAAIRAVRSGDRGHRPLVGWQEIGEGDSGEKAMIAKHFDEHYKNPFLRDGRAYRVPFSIPNHWTVVSTKRNFVHRGIEGWSPERWINEVVLRHVKYTGIEFALINSHYIANAYNGDRKPSLQDEWRKHRKLHGNRVLAHHAAGRPVIWTGDVNRPDYTTASGRSAEKKAFSKGIDRINWLPAGDKIQIQLQGTRTVDMDVDSHNARVAIFRIRLA
ncbi:hypothetical protein [Stackebrandtia nassauensis]|nr:hypothetical protein [Stackebrandtia nassauensis]